MKIRNREYRINIRIYKSRLLNRVSKKQQQQILTAVIWICKVFLMLQQDFLNLKLVVFVRAFPISFNILDFKVLFNAQFNLAFSEFLLFDQFARF